ncbi:MAG: superoxide dismutase [Phycisphaerales bacterium]
MAFTLPPLPYAADALEPHVDARTMEIHHGKHHNAYVTNANNALAETPMAGETDPWAVCARLGDVPEAKRTAVRNNAGGHANHSLFWQVMAPPSAGGGGTPGGDLGGAITKAFGSFDAFKEKFAAAAATRFGSGWAWLCVKPGGTLEVCSTANQDNPAMKAAIGDAAGCGGTPILGLDVWEHAYYLNYQNRRPDYVAAWWNVVNWKKVGELFAKARG